MPIELRHQTYFAYLDVPKDVRGVLRRRVWRRSLETGNPAVAKRRSLEWVAGWKAEIEAARGSVGSNDAKYWRGALAKVATEEERENIMARRFRDTLRRPPTAKESAELKRVLKSLGAEGGAQAEEEMRKLRIESQIEDHIEDADLSDEAADRFYGIAYGTVIPTTEFLDEYIASLKVKDKTAMMRRANIERLAKKFPTLNAISRKSVRRWVTELETDLRATTVQRMMSDCRGYWKYLAIMEAVPEESAPFDNIGLKVEPSSRLPFEASDVVKLLDAAIAREDNELADLIRLAMYSGARREELCSLKCEDVKDDCFDIVDAKTKSGIRTVPIHSALAQTMARLLDQSTDGYVLTELAITGYGSRGDALGKRFTRLKRSLGFGERHVFHSIRGTVITMLERAGAVESTVQDLVGHERSTLTGSTYSGKSTMAMRREAIEKLVYPEVQSDASTVM